MQRSIPFVKLNGHSYKRLPGNANISIEGINGGTAVLLLAEHGICCSSASACNTGEVTPSHVLKAIGLPDEVAKRNNKNDIWRGKYNRRHKVYCENIKRDY